MKTDCTVYAVRLDKKTRLALDAAAIGGNTRPRTLAARLIAQGLQRQGYLPRQPRRTQATAQA